MQEDANSLATAYKNARKEVNGQLKNEADFYGDIIIVLFMDRYELTICEIWGPEYFCKIY